jgi:hypothetical protein
MKPSIEVDTSVLPDSRAIKASKIFYGEQFLQMVDLRGGAGWMKNFDSRSAQSR